MTTPYEDLREAIATHAFLQAKDGHTIIASRLVGGGPAAWVFDFRALILQPHWLNRYAEIFWEKYADRYPFQICGMETGGIPLVAAIVMKSVERGTPVNGFYIRKSRKRSSLMKQVEGTVTDEPVILVDDLINTGRTSFRQALILAEANKRVLAIFVLLRFREMDAYAFAKERDITVSSLFTLEDFGLPLEVTTVKSPDDSFEVIWRFTGPDPSFHLIVQKSAPVLDDKRVFFGAENGTFYALDKTTGDVCWTFDVGKHPVGKGILSTPAIDGGTAYFGAYDGSVYALDAKDGAVRWRYDGADWVGSSPALAPNLGLLFIGLEFGLVRKRGGIVALDVKTGKEQWSARHPAFTHGSPLYIKEEDTVVIGSNDHTVYAYAARSGELRWKYETRGDVRSAPAYDSKHRLVLIASMDGTLYALDVRTGMPVWARQTGAGIYSIPLIKDDMAYIGSLDKTLYAVDIGTGKDRWTFETAGRIFGAPIIELGSLWIGSNDGRLYELDPITGVCRAYFQATERVMSRVAVDRASGYLYVRTAANEIICIKKKP